jgi:hypothetical protein
MIESLRVGGGAPDPRPFTRELDARTGRTAWASVVTPKLPGGISDSLLKGVDLQKKRYLVFIVPGFDFVAPDFGFARPGVGFWG